MLVRGTTLFPRWRGALMRYVFIPLPVITGGKPGFVYCPGGVRPGFGKRLGRDLRLDLRHPPSTWRGLSGAYLRGGTVSVSASLNLSS